jgi:hypothetical protein
MPSRSGLRTLAPLLALVVPATAPALARAASTNAGATRASVHALVNSRELWATIDVCNPKDQPNTVGIRGSMPGDRMASDRMYMSFRLQYMNPAGQWVDLASGSTPGYVSVGSSAAAREGGRSFQLVPVPGKPASLLRGVVDFRWRHGRTVIAHASRTTGAGHKSVAGADPAGFSAASCRIG